MVVDLLGLGKGEAWVNGNSLGRYWPSYLAPEEGCSNEPCDYRGSYDNKKCVSNCGQPTQRWLDYKLNYVKIFNLTQFIRNLMMIFNIF